MIAESEKLDLLDAETIYEKISTEIFPKFNSAILHGKMKTAEKDGIMKMNGVVRDMFYKHIPFEKSIRERLSKMPAFDQAANRYKNISVRNFTGFERRFKKYMDEEGNYPPKIAKYMEFLKR